MRLRQLRLKGFKSFANDTIINFNEDVIGIVGPNGSGKSNIVDAIRWVLGEQKTKELRLEKMTDVIFNGTKSRKKAGIAQVTLHFENSKNILPIEYNTVSISRIVYRSGESEYRLNDIPCRLKDITDLFRDTGIGSNSYAILALGMVDDLLSDKENARRKMFEQAAGISKFKTRKKETLNKLKSTSNDLDRVEDLLFEIEKNIKSLEKQARRTKRFIELKESYKLDSTQLALLSINEYKEEYKQLEAQIKKEEDTYRTNVVEQKKLEAEVEKIQKLHLDEELNLSQKQKLLNDIVHNIRTEENKKGILNQQLVFANQNIKKGIQSLSSNERNLSQVSNELSSLEEMLIVDQKLFDDYEKTLSSNKKEYESIKKAFNEAKLVSNQRIKKTNDLRKNLFDVEKEIAIYRNNIDNTTKSKTQKRSELDQFESIKKTVDLELTQFLKELDLENKQLEDAKASLNQIEEGKIKLRAEIKQEQTNLSRLNRNLDAKQNEFNLLKSMVDNLDGFPESIKYLHKKWKKDVPLLSDIISCAPEYKTVLELYLEPYLNYFIVQDMQEAVQAIDLLIDTKKGKAQFFLLDTINPILKKLPEIASLKTAISIIDTEPEFQALFELLLQNVYITDDDEVLKSYNLEEGYVLLSQHSGIYRAKNTISGGSTGLFGGKKLGRKKNLVSLEKSLKTLGKDKDKLTSQIDSLEIKLTQIDAKSIELVIDKARNAVKQCERSILVLETKKKNHDTQYLNLKDKIEKDDARLTTLSDQLSEAVKRQVGFSKQLDQLSNDGSSSEALEAFSSQLGSASEQFNTANVSFIRQENKLQNLNKDVLYRKNRIIEIEYQLTRNEKVIKKDKEKIIDIEAELKALDIQLIAAYEIKEKEELALNGVEQHYYEERKKIKDKEDQLRDINRLLQTQQVLINKQKESYNDIKFQIQSVNERLKIEFNISVNEIINDRVETNLKIEDLKERVFKIRTKIDQFGEVNPMAVETYEENKIRHEHIVVQRDDIMNARKSLESTINEIEKQATEKFLTAFTQVREHFINVFRTLFTADDMCDLILVDPNNPLESKIDIIAKPKGKRPQSLNQLSGGEKTLTATALLFALYLLKPAPFCIFDEIDAPLDDVNIQKFNKLILEFSKQSQFIIITHNKDTMTELGTMYGIFMQEPGISGISQVDFRSLVE